MARARSKSDSDDSSKKRKGAKEEEKPRKRPAKKAAEESPAAELEELRPSAEAAEEEREERDESSDDDESRPKPVLTPMNRALRDDDLQEARISGEETESAAAEAAAEEGPSETGGEHKQLQVLKLTDLKRMKITELTKMAHNLGIDSTQGLKKQELLVAILSNVTEKRYEVQAEGVM